MKTVAIITAAGHGKRMGRPKQFIEIGGKPMLEWTLAAFEKAKTIDEIILVVNKEDIPKGKKFKFSKLKKVVAGGEERQVSVANGLEALPADAEIIAVHDGARPFISAEIIESTVNEAKRSGAAVVGVPIKDTVKKATSDERRVTETIDRSELWAAQTPQVFRKDIILKAYQNSEKVTDDSMLVEKTGQPVTMVMGSYQNIKVTTPEDLEIALKFLKGVSR